MTLSEIRASIDAIDPQIKALLMQRLDCSKQVVEAKIASGETTIFRADREAAILSRLGEGVPEARKAGYLAVVRKIMETSRMYQYGLMYDMLDDPFSPFAEGLCMKENMTQVLIQLSLENRPNALASILGMIGDYGYNMERIELISENENHTVTFHLTIRGNLNETHMKKLIFQLSKESQNFRILECS